MLFAGSVLLILTVMYREYNGAGYHLRERKQELIPLKARYQVIILLAVVVTGALVMEFSYSNAFHEPNAAVIAHRAGGNEAQETGGEV